MAQITKDMTFGIRSYDIPHLEQTEEKDIMAS